MNNRVSVQQIAMRARQCLKVHEIVSLPVDPFALAHKAEIDVIPKPDTEEGVSGMLLRHGNSFGIIYATHIKSEGFQRFSVAHELGHYFLDGHSDHVLGEDGIHQSHAGYASGDRFEREADCFASNLLMPSHLFRPLLRTCPDSIEGIIGLASMCKTSLTATAIRFAELSDVPVAVVVSSGGRVIYCCASEGMRQFRGWQGLGKGDPLPLSVSLDLHRRGTTSGLVSGHSVFPDWFGGKSNIGLREESMHLGAYGRQLTLLVANCLPEDESEDSEDELESRWRPKF